MYFWGRFLILSWTIQKLDFLYIVAFALKSWLKWNKYQCFYGYLLRFIWFSEWRMDLWSSFIVSLYPAFSKLFLRPFSETQQAYVALRAHVWGDPYIWSSNVMGTDLRYTASGFSFKLCPQLFISSTINNMLMLWHTKICFAHENLQKIPSEVGYFSKIVELFSTTLMGPICPKTTKVQDSFEFL